jgi:hypothetical protein
MRFVGFNYLVMDILFETSAIISKGTHTYL